MSNPRRLTIESLETRSLLATISVATSVEYVENAAPVLVAPSAQLGEVDPESAADLAVNVVAGAASMDRLSLTPSAHISLVGTNVLYDGTVVGRVSANGTSFTVSFLSQVPRETMEAVLHRVSYEATGDAPATTKRTIVFELREATPAETYTYSGTQKVTVRKPDGWHATDSRPAIVLFHGGGWVGGGLGQFEHQASYYASIGMVALSASYRLNPANSTSPPMGAIQDAKSAIRWTREHAAELGIDPTRIAAGGGSAGGHLAATAGMVEGYDNPADNLLISSRPDALVLFSAVVDNSPQGYGFSLFGSQYTALSPAYNVSSDDPPVVFFHGGKDTLLKTAVVDQFHVALDKAGVYSTFYDFPLGTHTFFNFGVQNSSYFTQTLVESSQFLQSLGWLTKIAPIDVPEAYKFELGGYSAIGNNYSDVNVLAVNDAPKLFFSGSTGYHVNRTAVAIVPWATVSDSDSRNFSGGQLRVQITSGRGASNVLGIGAGFTVDAHQNILRGNVIIGKVNAGGGQQQIDLVISFNRQVTPWLAQQLVRAITFKTMKGSAGARDVAFTLSDGDGGTSATLAKRINVV